MKLNIAVIFWWRSPEHETSLQSARNILAYIDKEKFEIIAVWIDKNWKWFYFQNNPFFNEDSHDKIALNLRSWARAFLVPWESKIFIASEQREIIIDAAFPVLHWLYGEDWTIQWLFQMCNMPFVGSWVLSSACGIDKDITKKILAGDGIPMAKYIVINRAENVEYKRIFDELWSVLFVKPSHGGSSVWVSRAKNEIELKEAIIEAFKYDDKIIIEEYIKWREIECAVLWNDNIMASVVWEITTSHEFYSYEAKYLDNNGSCAYIPAKISEKVSEEIRQYAIKIYKNLWCQWLSRVDFFLADEDIIYFNEINTLPWFTKISMYPKLMEYSWISYSDLITKLIELAIARHNSENRIVAIS
jgi:D-alanine-D-alanine ligase